MKTLILFANMATSFLLPPQDAVLPDEAEAVSFLSARRSAYHFRTPVDEARTRAGWTRAELAHRLGVLITNVCERAEQGGSLSYDKAAYEQAIEDLAECGTTNELPYLDCALRYKGEVDYHGIFRSYSHILGFSHQAFETYRDMLFKTNGLEMCQLTASVNGLMFTARREGISGVETNRLVWLLLQARGDERDNLYPWMDAALARYMAGYAASSNRLEILTEGLLRTPDERLNTVCREKRNVLLSLPEGSLTWISTNQYYNVED